MLSSFHDTSFLHYISSILLQHHRGKVVQKHFVLLSDDISSTELILWREHSSFYGFSTIHCLLLPIDCIIYCGLPSLDEKRVCVFVKSCQWRKLFWRFFAVVDFIPPSEPFFWATSASESNSPPDGVAISSMINLFVRRVKYRK